MASESADDILPTDVSHIVEDDDRESLSIMKSFSETV